jgi:hypothetical protein
MFSAGHYGRQCSNNLKLRTLEGKKKGLVKPAPSAILGSFCHASELGSASDKLGVS